MRSYRPQLMRQVVRHYINKTHQGNLTSQNVDGRPRVGQTLDHQAMVGDQAKRMGQLLTWSSVRLLIMDGYMTQLWNVMIVGQRLRRLP